MGGEEGEMVRESGWTRERGEERERRGRGGEGRRAADLLQLDATVAVHHLLSPVARGASHYDVERSSMSQIKLNGWLTTAQKQPLCKRMACGRELHMTLDVSL